MDPPIAEALNAVARLLAAAKFHCSLGVGRSEGWLVGKGTARRFQAIPFLARACSVCLLWLERAVAAPAGAAIDARRTPSCHHQHKQQREQPHTM